MTDAARDPEIDRIIRLFAMERHPTAGWFAPHYRDSEIWGRAKLSSSYHLLCADDPLPLHKLDGVAIWHHYLGAAAEITVTNGSQMTDVTLLGPDLSTDQRPQLAVPAFRWQACRSLGGWSLLGCVMSPGYSARTTFLLDA